MRVAHQKVGRSGCSRNFNLDNALKPQITLTRIQPLADRQPQLFKFTK